MGILVYCLLGKRASHMFHKVPNKVWIIHKTCRVTYGNHHIVHTLWLINCSCTGCKRVCFGFNQQFIVTHETTSQGQEPLAYTHWPFIRKHALALLEADGAPTLPCMFIVFGADENRLAVTNPSERILNRVLVRRFWEAITKNYTRLLKLGGTRLRVGTLYVLEVYKWTS